MDFISESRLESADQSALNSFLPEVMSSFESSSTLEGGVASQAPPLKPVWLEVTGVDC